MAEKEAGGVIRSVARWLREPFVIGPPDCPILHRWSLIGGASPSSRPLIAPNFKRFTVKVHRFMPNADDRDVHNHPWPFATIVLRGGYDDLVPCPSCEGSGQRPYAYVGNGLRYTGHAICDCDGGLVVGDHMRAGKIKFRGAEHSHRTRTGSRGAWTIVITGPRLERDWGFFRDGRFWPWRDYEAEFGYAMRCDDLEKEYRR